MSTYSLLDLTAQVRAIGRASIFYGTGAFAGTGNDLALTQLGDTEGEIGIEANEEFSDLTLPELTGAAIHERYSSGLNPLVTIPIYAADAALRAILSSTGSGSGGYQRRRAVTEYSLAIFPEQLFIDDANAQVDLSYTTAGGWQKDGSALTTDEEALLDLSVWFWRGHFTRAMPIYRHEDGGKVIQEVSFQAMHNGDMPDGHHLFTIGDPADSSIEIAAA